MAQSELKHIPLNKIRENPVALRNVNRESEEYQGLVDSIRKDGVLNPIVVRSIVDPDTKEELYGLVDGLHRYTASQDAGRETIPAHVTTMEESKILEAQILANIHKVETKPVEYSKQLVRILAQNPLMTTSELAATLSKSPTWLVERLGLTKLAESIASLVDEGKINLSNAYALAKLPAEEQPNFLDRAMTMQPQEFVPTVNGRIKELRDAKRQGRAATPAEFVPVARLRKVGEVKEEFQQGTVGKVLCAELKPKSVEEAFALGVAWALHMDPASVAADRQKDKEAREAREAEKEKRKKEREEKAKQEAASKAADLSAALGAK